MPSVIKQKFRVENALPAQEMEECFRQKSGLLLIATLVSKLIHSESK